MTRRCIHVLAITLAAAPAVADARELSREELLECHSDVAAVLGDMIVDHTKFGIENAEARAAMETKHKFFTAYAMISKHADADTKGKAYLAEMFQRSEAKYPAVDAAMSGPEDEKRQFVTAFIASLNACEERMREHPDFELIPRSLAP